MAAYEALRSIEPGDLLAERAYAQLSAAILRNELEPGTSLSVPELARRLGISRSPVREAVQRLIYDGLADYRGRRGTVVSAIALSDFIALLEVREVLEGLAARLAAVRASDRDRQGLDRIHVEFMNVPTKGAGSESEFVERDMGFHERIRRMAGNEDLNMALARTQGRAHLSMHSLWAGHRNIRAAQEEHGAICVAILAGDADGADTAARRHISQLRERVLADNTGKIEAEAS